MGLGQSKAEAQLVAHHAHQRASTEPTGQIMNLSIRPMFCIYSQLNYGSYSHSVRNIRYIPLVSRLQQRTADQVTASRRDLFAHGTINLAEDMAEVKNIALVAHNVKLKYSL